MTLVIHVVMKIPSNGQRFEIVNQFGYLETPRSERAEAEREPQTCARHPDRTGTNRRTGQAGRSKCHRALKIVTDDQ
jgi:hypothetical protein